MVYNNIFIDIDEVFVVFFCIEVSGVLCFDFWNFCYILKIERIFSGWLLNINKIEIGIFCLRVIFKF